MATKQLLIKALQRPYDRILFAKEILNPVFGSGFTLFNEPVLSSEQPNKTELQVLQEPVYKYGEIVLEDGTEVNCFEITLQPNVRIEQSRVAIQHFVRKLLTAGQAALVNFVSPTTDNIWRLTLVAKDSEITDDGIKEKTTHSKRYTYLVEKDRPNRTLAERLEDLSLETVIDFKSLVKAFSVETMSKEFFDEYKHHYQNFGEYLTGKRSVKERGKWVEKQVSKASPFLVSVFNGKEKDARNFNKKLLGRIVFLYFVQKKRWLGASSTEYIDGSYDFIYQLFEETGGDTRFFPLGLTELFFNVLNKERPNDNYTTPTGETVKIPYLNGGLFTRDEVDEILHKKGDLMTFPPHLFSNPDLKDVPYERGFLDFLNAYNFTVYEDSPNDHTVAVDPEMLGHIFENLLEDNKDKGAYYTPKEIVSYMCRESLTEYLITHLSKEYKVYREVGNDQVELFGNEVKTGQLSMMEEIGDKALNRKNVEQIVKDKSIDGLTNKQLKRINQLLDDVKICDPAIGSGAFPMGLLLEIYTIKEMIAHELYWDWKPDVVKEHIIQNSIYGVDIEKGAVDIARLRFWLSLIVDIEKPKALPNLDYKIVEGDSLVSKVKIDGTEEIVEINWDLKSSVGEADTYVKNIQKLLKEVVDKQTDFFDPNAKNKTKRKQEIRNLKIELLINQLKFEKEKFQGRSASSQDMFDSRKTKEQLGNELRVSGFNKLIDKLEKLQRQQDKPFVHFNWKLDFPEVLNPYIKKDGIGFDIVIANPPYLKERDNAHIFRPVNESAFGKLWHQGKMDYWYYFLHKAIDINSSSGVISFITSRYWINNQGATKLIKRVNDHLSFCNVVDIGKLKVFDNVAGHHMISIFSKTANDRFTYKRVVNDVTRILSPYESENIKINVLSNQVVFKDDKEIIFSTPLFDESMYDNLGKYYDISQGVVEAPDKISSKQYKKTPRKDIIIGQGVFVLTDEELNELKLTKEEMSVIKPYLDPYDIDKYIINENEQKYLIYSNKDSKELIQKNKNFKNLKKHLENVSEYITSSNGPYGLHRPREESFFEKEKIIFKNMFISPEFAIDSEQYYFGMSFSSIISNSRNKSLKALLAILNSKVAAGWFFTNGKQRGAGVDIGVEKLRSFPIPIFIEVNKIEAIVDYVIFLKKRIDNDLSLKLMVNFFEHIIDGMVYELYFPELLKKHNREIIKHLGELPELKEGMSDDEKMKICKAVFNRLDDKSHPVRNNLFYMNSIPEIRIIEGKDENN